VHAWLCENPVGVDALNWKEIPTPVPQSGQVLIRIEAASLNFPDLLIVQNKYQMKPDLPFVPGSEYAGVIEALGEGVTHLKVGQSVACLSVFFSSYAASSISSCLNNQLGSWCHLACRIYYLLSLVQKLLYGNQ
jgi:NADPH:quinone reductase-like Zn-dependent oxidoreductase